MKPFLSNKKHTLSPPQIQSDSSCNRFSTAFTAQYSPNFAFLCGLISLFVYLSAICLSTSLHFLHTTTDRLWIWTGNPLVPFEIIMHTVSAESLLSPSQVVVRILVPLYHFYYIRGKLSAIIILPSCYWGASSVGVSFLTIPRLPFLRSHTPCTDCTGPRPSLSSPPRQQPRWRTNFLIHKFYYHWHYHSLYAIFSPVLSSTFVGTHNHNRYRGPFSPFQQNLRTGIYVPTTTSYGTSRLHSTAFTTARR